jgi:hypothetical protein
MKAVRHEADAAHAERTLDADLAALRAALDAHLAGEDVIEAPDGHGTALGLIARLFGLTPAARRVLLLAAGAELDTEIGARVAALRGMTGEARADVATALAHVPVGGWEALCPGAALRRWRLVELRGRGPHLRQEIAVDERVLQFLTGLGYVDSRLEGIVRPLAPTPEPSPAEAALAARLAGAWDVPGRWPVLVVAGEDALALRTVMQETTERAGLNALALDAGSLPAEAAAAQALAVLIDRELALSGAALIIETPDAAATRLADRLVGPVALVGRDPSPPATRPRLRGDLAPEARAGRRLIWQRTVGPRAEALGDGIDRLAEQFALDRGGVEAAVTAALSVPPRPEQLFGALWEATRAQARRGLDGLAERIVSTAGWDDLVLPRDQAAQLRELADHVHQAWRVRDAWGWEARGARGLGAAALFAGPSGTGKTLAAEVLAGELALDLYRIDLSQVVSKYIGETEKNLERIFGAAEDGGAILLFDEADALFGKRSEVRDSHDRYANVEVSYLLQRMETYRGLAILTSNQRSALDQAFLRRLRAVITFPFPDAAARAAIWARAFPDATPCEGLAPERLARLNLTGGSIRSVALNAAFLAAAEDASVRPEHVLRAARREYAKLDKPFTAAEMGAFR